jgi:hypothetical protein
MNLMVVSQLPDVSFKRSASLTAALGKAMVKRQKGVSSGIPMGGNQWTTKTELGWDLSAGG